MKIPLALLNMRHQKVRTLVAIGGVTFAIVLVFMQLGFYGSAAASAIVLLRNLQFDIILIAPGYLTTNRPNSFARSLAYETLAVDGVQAGAPLYVGTNLWRVKDSRKRRNLLVVGLNLADREFVHDRVFPSSGAADLDRLKIPDTVLMDTQTRAYFGPRGPGLETELGVTRITVVGNFTVGTGYGADGMVLVSDNTFSHVFGSRPMDDVSFFLLKVKPGADLEKVAETISKRFPADEVRVRTHAQMEEQEQDYWLHKTSVGVIFAIGVFVALVVGTVFVYQVISSDVTAHFAEFATLKAMGYGQRYLSGVVLQQAFLLAFLGYVPGLILSVLLYRWGRAEANLSMEMTWTRATFVLVLSIGMCALSGILALNKVKAADPADLF